MGDLTTARAKRGKLPAARASGKNIGFLPPTGEALVEFLDRRVGDPACTVAEARILVIAAEMSARFLEATLDMDALERFDLAEELRVVADSRPELRGGWR